MSTEIVMSQEVCEHGMDAYLCGGPMHWYDDVDAYGGKPKSYGFPPCRRCGAFFADGNAEYIHYQVGCGDDMYREEQIEARLRAAAEHDERFGLSGTDADYVEWEFV